MKIHNKNQNPINPTTTSISSTSKKALKRSEEEQTKERMQSLHWGMVCGFGDYLIRFGQTYNDLKNRLKKDSITDELCLAFDKVHFALEKAEEAIRMEEERHSNKFEVGEYEPFIHFKCLPKHIKTKVEEYGEERVTMGKIREWMTNEEWFQFEISVSIGEGIWEASHLNAEIDRLIAKS